MNILSKITLLAIVLCSIITQQTHAAPTLEAHGLLQIQCSFERPEGAPIIQKSLGFIIEADGHLLSSYQAIVDPDSKRLSGDIMVSLQADGTPINLPAVIVGVEPTLNLAILKIHHEQPLEVLPINNSRELAAHEPVHAFYRDEYGAYKSIAGTFTEMNQLECYQYNLTATMLKTEIQLPEDSIGAPILDGEGKVFAMHTAHSPEPEDEELEINPDEVHLLSMKLAMNIYQSLKLRGSTLSPWTGFSVRQLSAEESARFPLLKNRVRCGIAIEHVWENEPAAKLGIQSGDIFFKFAHYPICSVSDFQRWLYMYGVGSNAKIHLVRDGQELIILDYTIEERPTWAKPL